MLISEQIPVQFKVSHEMAITTLLYTSSLTNFIALQRSFHLAVFIQPIFYFFADAVMVKMSSFMPLSYMLVTANIFSFNDLMENLE